jgi:cytidylate kinase
MNFFVVTIDGPAASGKSTVARRLAARMDAVFLDTGAMYRAVTLAAMNAGVDLSDEQLLLQVMEDRRFKFLTEQNTMRVIIDGADVTEKIRSREVTANARYIAAAPKVREQLVLMQRRFAAEHEMIVTEGRDQGTVAFPDASVKFYLTADPQERAKRRLAELPDDDSATVEQIKSEIEQRDRSDQDRDVGPLKPAADAVVVDTTDLTIEQVVQKLFDLIVAK